MLEKELILWVDDIKKKLPVFLSDLRKDSNSGFYSFTKSSNIFPNWEIWGLGNAIFVLKTYYILNIKLPNINKVFSYINSFNCRDGKFKDNLILYFSLPLRILAFFRTGQHSKLAAKEYFRAESRQSISTLALFNVKPKYEYAEFPKTKNEIAIYIDKLNWVNPWAAGSHFSHMMFFISSSKLLNKKFKKQLLIFAYNYINLKLLKEDGFWYSGKVKRQEKINGAMKIMTGIYTSNQNIKESLLEIKESQARKFINYILDDFSTRHACDNFNTVYVLCKSSLRLNNGYRFQEIKKYLYLILDEYKEYYFPETGAFSFNKNKSKAFYYNSPIGLGKNEPDVHGTLMFLWAISFIGYCLKINNKIRLTSFEP